MYTPITFTHYKRETLLDDFGIWWNMPKYRKQEIEAKKYGNQKIVEKKVGNYGWPGPEKDVKYWVVLENGKAVGMRHGKSDSGLRRKKYADFPVYEMIWFII